MGNMYLNEEQAEEFLTDSDVEYDGYYETVPEELQEDYRLLYANALFNMIYFNEEKAIEISKGAVMEYYDIEELYNGGYIVAGADFTEEEQAMLEDDDFDDINFDHWEFLDYMFLDHVVGNNYNDSNVSLRKNWFKNEEERVVLLYWSEAELNDEKYTLPAQEQAIKALLHVKLQKELPIQSASRAKAKI